MNIKLLPILAICLAATALYAKSPKPNTPAAKSQKKTAMPSQTHYLTHRQLLARAFELAELRPTNRGGRNITPELLKQYFSTPDRDFELSDSPNPEKHATYFAQYGAHSPDSSDIGHFIVMLTKSYDKNYNLGEYASVEFSYEHSDIQRTKENIMYEPNLIQLASEYGFKPKEHWNRWLKDIDFNKDMDKEKSNGRPPELNVHVKEPPEEFNIYFLDSLIMYF